MNRACRSVWLTMAAVFLAAPLLAQPPEVPATILGATASTHDGNVPANAIDNNLATRWSANGDGQWIQLELSPSPGPVVRVDIAVYNGTSRKNRFDLQTSYDGAAWTTVFSGETSGTTLQKEPFRFPGQFARYVRYVGHGSNVGTWNSVTEISVYNATDQPTPTPTPTFTPTPSPTPPPTVTPTPTVPLPDQEITPPGSGASASANDGNLPGNAVDNSLATRWSANGDGHWLQLDLGGLWTVSRVSVAAYVGNTRRNRFDLLASSAPTGPWTALLTAATTSGTTTSEESFDVSDVNARYVRYVGHGNTSTDPARMGWNSVTELSVFGYPCSGCATPTPTATPTLPPRPTITPTPTTPPGGFPPRTFAPYAETWNNRSLTGFASANGGHKFYTLAFIINGGGTCNPMWNGNVALGTYYRDHIQNLRNIGGDVIVSFGGAAGTEIGLSCGTVSSLQAAYQKVIDAYNIKWIDLDIEGDEMGNTASIDRRNKAIAALQAVNPGLRVSYTLAVDRSGLPSGQINLLRNAKANGARVDVVNIMAMDYGPCYSDMGQAAIDAANNTHNQLIANAINSTVGVTPMINTNDITCEVFRTSDSQLLTNWAQTHSFVTHLAFWSEDRDISAGYPHTRIMHNFR